MDWYTIEFKDKDGKVVATLTADAKNFKTGSRGFYAGGKVSLVPKGGGRPLSHQVGMNIIEVGSKLPATLVPTDESTLKN